MECTVHKEGVTGKIIKFSATALEKVKLCAEKWIDLGNEKIPQVTVAKRFCTYQNPEEHGYNRNCYSDITNKTNLDRARKRTLSLEAPEPIPEQNSQKRVLRSSIEIDQSGPVLPKVCVICGKTFRRFRKHGNTVIDKLTHCETIQAGKHVSATDEIIRLSRLDMRSVLVPYLLCCVHAHVLQPAQTLGRTVHACLNSSWTN